MNGTNIIDLDMRRLVNVAYVVASEGHDREEFDALILDLGSRLDTPERREERLRETWGTSPAAIAGQAQLKGLLGQFE